MYILLVDLSPKSVIDKKKNFCNLIFPFFSSNFSAVPHSSPLKEPNRHEENSIDSPIKVNKKAKKKRLDSSSEEENGSPKSIKKGENWKN